MEAFDKDKYERLKEAYRQAVKLNLDSFFFDGQEYLTTYAKYVIEYLKLNFEP